MTHTPGPWRVDGLLIKAVDHGKWYGIAKAGGSKLTIKGNMANARLIASAPELLAACQLALQLVKDNWIHEHGQEQVGIAWGALESAIAKAVAA